MTNDVFLDDDLDIELDNEDLEPQVPEPPSSEPLNPDYDAVSKNGAMPDMSMFNVGETGREIDDPFGNSLSEMPDYGNYGSFDNEIGESMADNNQEDTDENAENEDEAEQKLSLWQMLNSKNPNYQIGKKFVKPIIYLGLLCVIIISYHKIVEDQLNKMATLSKSIEKHKGESIVLANQLANFCKETQVTERVESQSLGIHCQKEPPKYIVIHRYQRPDSLQNEEELFLNHRNQLPRLQVAQQKSKQQAK